MYVRWQERKRQQPGVDARHGELRDETETFLHTRGRADGSVGQDIRWTAVVVESVRVNGRPREHHVALLASITESRIDVDHQRRYFWDAVYDRLDQLGDRISIDDRRHIEESVARKVPRLSREEHDASIRSTARYDTDAEKGDHNYYMWSTPTAFAFFSVLIVLALLFSKFLELFIDFG